MKEFPPLNEAQQVALEQLTTLIGADGINHMASKGVDAFFARLNGYMQFKATLVGQVRTKLRHPDARLHLTRNLRLVPTCECNTFLWVRR